MQAFPIFNVRLNNGAFAQQDAEECFSGILNQMSNNDRIGNEIKELFSFKFNIEYKTMVDDEEIIEYQDEEMLKLGV